MEDYTPTRRGVLFGLGTLAAGGGALAALPTEATAQAEVTTDALDAEDSPLVEARAADSVTVRVTASGIETSANVRGSGSVAIQASESGGSPV